MINFNKLFKEYKKSNLNYQLPVMLGEDEEEKPQFADLVDLKHILMTGSTGSGKSVFENVIITTFMSLFSSNELRLFLVDMKRVDLVSYKGSPYLLTPNAVVEFDKFYSSLDWLIQEKDRRFKINEASLKQSPYIIAVIDTFSDLIAENSQKFQDYMGKLIDKAAEVKIHIVMSDSRPSTDVYTRLILGLFPTKICFNVTAEQDSKKIIGRGGGEKLKGKGDMLFLPPYLKEPVRIQAPWISEEEIQALVKKEGKGI